MSHHYPQQQQFVISLQHQAQLQIKLQTNGKFMIQLLSEQRYDTSPSLSFIVEYYGQNLVKLTNFESIEQRKHSLCLQDWLIHNHIPSSLSKIPNHLQRNFVYELASKNRTAAMKNYFKSEHLFKNLHKQTSASTTKWDNNTINMLQDIFEHIYDSIILEKEMVQWLQQKQRQFRELLPKHYCWESESNIIEIELDSYGSTVKLEKDLINGRILCNLSPSVNAPHLWQLHVQDDMFNLERHLTAKEKRNIAWRDQVMKQCEQLLLEQEDENTKKFMICLMQSNGLQAKEEAKRMNRIVLLQHFETKLRCPLFQKSKVAKLQFILAFFHNLQQLDFL